MEHSEKDKRREARLPIAVGASVSLRGWPLLDPAVTLNASSTGVLLRFACPMKLELGEVVTCEFEAFDQDGNGSSTPAWVQGAVVRVDGNHVALQFTAVIFDELPTEASGQIAA